MASALLSRRAMLGHGVAAAVLAKSLPAFSQGAPHDPLLDLLTKYQADEAIYNATTGLSDEESDALEAANWGPLWHGVIDGDIILPAATTVAGAVLALRIVKSQMEDSALGEFEEALITAALAFFEERSA